MPVQHFEPSATIEETKASEDANADSIEVLIKEARRHQRRRQILIVGVCVLAALLSVGLTFGVFGSGSQPTPSVSRPGGRSSAQSSLEAKRICDQYTPTLTTGGVPTKLIHWSVTTPGAVLQGQLTDDQAIGGSPVVGLPLDGVTELPWNSTVSLCYFSGSFGPFSPPGAIVPFEPPSSAGPIIYKTAGFVVTKGGQGISVYYGKAKTIHYGRTLPAEPLTSSEVEAKQICTQYMPKVSMQDGPFALAQWHLMAPGALATIAWEWHTVSKEPKLNWPVNSTVALCDYSGSFLTPGVPSGELGPPPGHFNTSIYLVTSSGQGVMVVSGTVSPNSTGST